MKVGFLLCLLALTLSISPRHHLLIEEDSDSFEDNLTFDSNTSLSANITLST